MACGSDDMCPSALRHGDGDLYPEVPSPRRVTISRPPDSTAGSKRDPDRADGGVKAKREKAFSPVLWVVAWGLGGGLALWLYFQLAGLLKIVLECQGWRFGVALVLFLIPVAALSWVSVRFWTLFRKLPNRKQVRGDLHTSDVARKEELKRLLKQYMEDLRGNGKYVDIFKSEDRQKVTECIGRMCDDLRYSDAGGWIDDFNHFQECQEVRAHEVVKTYCRLVALKTAACPWKAVDMIIVLVNLTLMVESIARVYNRRVSRGGAFRLLCHWFANIYISGELGAITEHASDKVADWLTGGDGARSGMEAGAPAAEAAAGQAPGGADLFSTSLPVLSRFAGKAAEGAINAFLAYRMGKRAIGEFRFFVQSDEAGAAGE